MSEDQTKNGEEVAWKMVSKQVEDAEERNKQLPAGQRVVKIGWLCFQLHLKQKTLFILLLAVSIFSAVGFTTFQEQVFNVKDFHYGGWVTLWTLITYFLCALMERIFTNDTVRKAPMKSFCQLAVITFGGMYFTNWSLKYINYTTRIVFKSSKVLPTMFFGTVLQGKKYVLVEYIAATMLIAGISMFSLGDKEGMPNFNFWGIVLITIGVCCDAVTSNFEEKRFFRRENPCSQAEIMYYSSVVGIAYMSIVLAVTGELMKAIMHSLEHWEVVPLIVTSSSLGYVSVSVILLMIKYFGATNTEIVKSSRKVLQILASFLLFPKPPNYKYVVGGLAVVLGIGMLSHYQINNPTEEYNKASVGEPEKEHKDEQNYEKV